MIDMAEIRNNNHLLAKKWRYITKYQNALKAKLA